MSSSYSTHHSRRKEVAAARLKRRPRAQAALPLSAVLAQHPQLFDGRRITAVDKNVCTIDALRCASEVRTLYLSKNSLATLEGVQQFTALKALSAADNQLGDLAALAPLRAAGIQLEAANFEGNPLADLPNYRAHVVELLGPSLQSLDNRAVTPEERAAAPGAVAHEATMLALMLSNACLVHKLGRGVQLVRLHCELKCAVLGGLGGAPGAPPHDGLAALDTARFLQLWDYEGSLNRQERHAILLAIRREVGRRYKRMLLAGAKLDGSAKAWQQAFAQVMLAQQETVASLMKMLEDARVEAAAVLAPLVRPASPMKLRAVRGGQEADCRVKHDREALITELRDAFLELTDGSGSCSPRRSNAQYERIRALHAALQSSSCAASQPEAATDDVDWSIPAARDAAGQAANSPAASPSKPAQPRPKSALKQPAAARSPALASKPAGEGSRPSTASTPRAVRPTSGSGAKADARRGARPSSAASQPPASPAVPPREARGNLRSPSKVQEERAAQSRGAATAAGAAAAAVEQDEEWEGEWQPDDGLALWEQPVAEQHRTSTPTPHRNHSTGPGSCEREDAQPQQATMGAAHVGRPRTAPACPASAGSPQRAPQPVFHQAAEGGGGNGRASHTRGSGQQCLSPV